MQPFSLPTCLTEGNSEDVLTHDQIAGGDLLLVDRVRVQGPVFFAEVNLVVLDGAVHALFHGLLDNPYETSTAGGE